MLWLSISDINIDRFWKLIFKYNSNEFNAMSNSIRSLIEFRKKYLNLSKINKWIIKKNEWSKPLASEWKKTKLNKNTFFELKIRKLIQQYGYIKKKIDFILERKN